MVVNSFEHQLMQSIAGEIVTSKSPGGSLKKWREIFEISQIDLANYLNISPSTISDYEGGRRKSPGIVIIKRFCSALVEIDKNKGSKTLNQLKKNFSSSGDIFLAHEFYQAIPASDFVKAINGKTVILPNKIKNIKIYGYTLIDSIKAILGVQVHDYLKFYGKTPERALIFKGVETGRSPMIAVRVGRFSTAMKPSLIVLHNLENIDPVAIKIAEVEKIPLVITNISLDKLEQKLSEFE